MTKIQIRPATAADAPGMANVHVQSWRETYGGIVPEAHLAGLDVAVRTQRWQDNFLGAKPPWQVFVAVSDGGSGDILGFVSLGAAREDFGGFAGELYALYLLRAAQGTGTGRQLFDAARQSLKSCGINAMYLWVLADNPAAGFYRHMGGRELGRKMLDIGGKSLEEIAYGWEEL
ncbi:MAG: GNAT family N-acetyltransferase [Alphaproteobacteria bacterium]